MAKELARELGYVYVDSGAMYRAVTLWAMRHGLMSDGVTDEERLEQEMGNVSVTFKLNRQTMEQDTYLCGECVEREIRSLEVSENVSPIATLPFVRQALVRQQRRMGARKGIVMDGRDIGTTVFPDAELKVFVTASPKVRARRRYDELTAKGQQCNYDEILRNVQERDYIDSHRSVSPLRRAEDAIVLDNSDMSLEEQRQWLLELAMQRIEEA